MEDVRENHSSNARKKTTHTNSLGHTDARRRGRLQRVQNTDGRAVLIFTSGGSVFAPRQVRARRRAARHYGRLGDEAARRRE